MLYGSLSVVVSYGQKTVDVAESSIKVGIKAEEEVYFGFAEGDKLIFSFEEANGKEMKEVEIVEMPSSSKFLEFKTSKIDSKTINVASPADSALIKLMLGDCGTAPNVTPRMPREQCWDGDKPEENEYCVPTATVAAVQAWIAKGAPQQ